MAASFVPRTSFPVSLSLPRSYFLGHHAAGLSKMKTMLSSIDLIVECRDYRVPLTSRNPLFEQALAGRERLIIYTKRDLGSKNRPIDFKRESVIRSWHRPATVLFSDHKSKDDVRKVLDYAKGFADRADSLTGSRLMVVGMPNVGKSSLLNALRLAGVKKGKAAITGGQPGITRKIGSGVKIVEPDPDRGTQAVYVLDTPGVFIPFVPNAESMLKLALCGSVKDTVIQPVTLADYLLYHINQHSTTLYKKYCPATNDIMELLEAICRKTGRLQKGGIPDTDAAALWMIQRWRSGEMGHFVLDDISDDGLLSKQAEEAAVSLNQARKRMKQEQISRRQAAAVE